IEKNDGKMCRHQIRRHFNSSSSATPASLHIRGSAGAKHSKASADISPRSRMPSIARQPMAQLQVLEDADAALDTEKFQPILNFHSPLVHGDHAPVPVMRSYSPPHSMET